VGEKKGRRKKQKKEGGEMSEMKRKLLIFLLFSCYFLALMPYIVHSNIEDAGGGIVKEVKIMPFHALPEDLRDVIHFESGGAEEGSDCMLILLENPISEERKVMLVAQHSHVTLAVGDVVEIKDIVVDWFVDWHAYNFFGVRFSNLVVGSAERVSEFEASVEGVLCSPLGGVVFSLSKLVFLFAPILLAIYISKYRFRLWNIPLIITLYAFEVFLFNYFGQLHDLTISDMSKYFGYSFIIFAILSFLLWKYEESAEGKAKIEQFYERISEWFSQFK